MALVPRRPAAAKRCRTLGERGSLAPLPRDLMQRVAAQHRPSAAVSAASLRRQLPELFPSAAEGTRPDVAVTPQLVTLMGTSGGGSRTRRAAQRAGAQLALPSLRRCQRPRGRSPAVPRLRCCQPGAVSSSAADFAASPATPRLMRLLLPTGRHGDGSFWPVDTNLIDRSSLNGRCRLCPTPLRKEGRFPQ